MTATLSAMASLLLMMQAAPATATRPGDVVGAPAWLSRPTAEDMERAFPPAADRENRSGAATMKCAIAADGHLRNCRVLAELPEGYGFGDAVLRLAPRFRMDMKKSPHPSEASTIVQSVRFSLPGQAEGLRVKLAPGEVVSLVTVLDGAASPGAVTAPCASPTAPERRCQFHAFDWAVMPTSARTDTLLAQSDQQEGPSLMECRVTAGGALTSCKAGGASTRNQTALLELSKDYRAPQKAIDGTPIAGGRVVLRFDWKLLAELKGPLPGEPAPAKSTTPAR